MGGGAREATGVLNKAVDLMYQIRMDEETFELPFVPFDQLFAIFGSLLLPLFVPIIKNTIIEVKRYKESTKAKQQSV